MDGSSLCVSSFLLCRIINQAPKIKKEQYQKMLLDKLIDYIEDNEGEDKAYLDNNKYWLRMVRQCDRLKEIYGY